MFSHQNVGQNHNIGVANEIFEILAKLKYLATCILHTAVKYENYNSTCLCGCETMSLISRKEQGLRMFNNKMLKRIFVPNGENS
jgi:hypothetical protein